MGDKCESRLPSTVLHFCFISLLLHSYYGSSINKDIVKGGRMEEERMKFFLEIFIWKGKKNRPPLDIKIQLQFINIL